jgi:hypothetical protein
LKLGLSLAKRKMVKLSYIILRLFELSIPFNSILVAMRRLPAPIILSKLLFFTILELKDENFDTHSNQLLYPMVWLLLLFML